MGMDVEKLAQIAEQELSAITSSTTKKFEIMLATLKESLIPIGEKMLQIFTAVGNAMQPIFNWFKDNSWAMWAVGFAAAGAAVTGGAAAAAARHHHASADPP
jgi:hypothetical protein